VKIDDVPAFNGVEMSILFLVAILAMSLFAIAIVSRPLLVASKNDNKGFAQIHLLAIAAVILLAIGLYALIGRPEATTWTAETRTAVEPGNSTMSQANAGPGSQRKAGSIASLLSGLEERLKNEPNDAGGWLLLAKSYQRLGRSADARDAYAKAEALGQGDSNFAASLVAPEQSSIAVAEIRGRVSVSDDAARSLSETDTVFVIARAVSGSSIPLAVFKSTAAALPFEFVLSDAMAMVKGSGISSVPEVIVSAKVSKSGDALQTKVGFEVHSRPVATANSPYMELEIDPTASADGT
jgi:hypothetical protein